jgi:hypothetical protein
VLGTGRGHHRLATIKTGLSLLDTVAGGSGAPPGGGTGPSRLHRPDTMLCCGGKKVSAAQEVLRRPAFIRKGLHGPSLCIVCTAGDSAGFLEAFLCCPKSANLAQC